MTSLAEALNTPGHGRERSFNCPVHGDTRPSASVNVVTGFWYCYTCGAKGKAGADYTIDPLQLVKMVKERAHFRERKVKPESWLSLYDAGPVHPYWLGRFTEAAAKQFRLGYDAERDAVTYPMRDRGGHVLGVVRRPLNGPEDGPKYVYPYGVDVGQYMFNYSTDVRRKVCLVEGAADSIACWDAGVEAFAIYGSRMSRAQLQLLDRCGAMEVYAAFDLDQAGDDAYENIKRQIRDKTLTRITWDKELGKDVAELDLETRQKLLQGTFGLNRVERVESNSCESSQSNQPLRQIWSGSTSTPGTLRIRRQKP